MEMEVVVPVPNPMDFNFDSACSSPYMTAPSSPQRFGNLFFSAPTSPTRATAFYNGLHNLSLIDDDINHPRYSSSSIPFKWEEKPGIPKCSTRASFSNHGDRDGQDFEFDFSGQLDIASLSAEELFDGGKIRPLKPPPRLHVGAGRNGTATAAGAGNRDYDSSSSSLTSPRSPRSRISQGRKMVQEALSSSPRQKKKDFDPFSAAIDETRRKCYEINEQPEEEEEVLEKRGRGRSPSSGFARKGTRSLSPLRVSDIVLDAEDTSSSMEKTVSPTTKPSTSSSSSSSPSAYSSILSAISFSKGYRKWRLKDFLLFRSASEGRATDKDPLRKYAALSKKSDDVKNSSFRSTESVGSVSSRRRGPVSAHEMHYTMNRAVAEEMRKKTVLPYKHGLLGCLGFNHGMQEISRSFGSLTRG